MQVSRRRILQVGAAAVAVGPWVKNLWASATGAVGSRALTDTSRSPHAMLRSVNMDAVRWQPGFWADRFETARTVTIPTMWDVIDRPDNGCTFATFREAAGGPKEQTYVTPYSDGDFYKWVEGVAHIYNITRDPELDARMDKVIAVIIKAQAKDGYISTPLQAEGKKRFQNINNHELYNMGHLMTAACVHKRATGKDTLLGVATRAADYLYITFSPRPPELAHFCFNPSQIMGLVELYRLTQNPKYLELAGIYISNRGSQPGGTDQNQDRTPLRDAKEAVGHAVLAAYLYAGAADYLAEKDDPELKAALDRMWDDVENRKVYVTGAIGALHAGSSASRQGDPIHEAFGMDFQLPNRTAYNETCANIANAMWNWRLLTLTGDAKYADMMERVFFNSMLSGISLKGSEYFYTNVLRRDASLPMLGNDTLERWPNTADRRPPNSKLAPAFCCPPNVLRQMAGMHEYFYSTSNDGVWVHFFGANTLDTTAPNGRALHLIQTANYPWDGAIQLRVGEKMRGQSVLRIRVPGWAEGATLKVNGKAVPATPGTYAAIDRVWKPGDVVTLDLPMKVRMFTGSPHVDETRGQVAVMRGPLVYCVESTDLAAGLTIDDLSVTPTSFVSEKHEPGLLRGVTTLKMKGHRTPTRESAGALYQPLTDVPRDEIEFTMIPYYAWDNRGKSSMTVWMPLTA